MIPENHVGTIIQSGINFMKAITTAYGSDEGMKLWDSIVSTLDPDIKGKIFWAMITGEYNGIVHIRNVEKWADKIGLIKEIRNATGFGLREAKDLIDEVFNGKSIKLDLTGNNHEEREKTIINMRRYGALI